MAERYLHAPCLIVGPGSRPGCRSGSTTRTRSAPTASSTRSPPTTGSAAPASSSTSAPASTSTRSPAPASTSAGRSRPGSRSRWTALTERGAKIPRIELAEPEGAIGKSTRAAIQSGVDLRLRRADRRDRPADRCRARRRGRLHRHRRAGRRDRPFCETIDEVDDLLTLTGLRLIWERTLTQAAPHRARSGSATWRSPTASCSRRWPGSATGSCACRRAVTAPGSRSPRWSRASRSPPQRAHDARDAPHPPDEEHPVSIQLFGHDPEVMRGGRRSPPRPAPT